MKLLVDTNIVLDVLLDREPWSAEAASLLSTIERGGAEGYIAGHAVSTVYFIVSRAHGHDRARQAVSDLLDILEVVPATQAVFRRALTLPFADFEDAVHAACALKVGAACIVMRNEKDFRAVEIPAKPAGAVLAQL